MTAEVQYLGGLRTTCTHVRSGDTVITDAPTDNNGKGEAFSPTDLVATGLAACMITMMGIHADKNKLQLKGTKATVLKTMTSGPRRIAAVDIELFINNANLSNEERQTLEDIALNCPVALSLRKDLAQNISFKYPLSKQ